MGTNGDSAASGVRDRALVEMLVGQELNGFRIEGPIGAGGMGTVFRATQLSIGRTVAVKVIREHSVPNGAERFLREARVISQLSHPNVVQLIDFGHRSEDGLMFYAMEHIDGAPVDALLRAGRVHPNLAIELGMQIASALTEAHAGGVVHRDLKASNMLVTVDANGSVRLRVLDFGIAHSFEDTADLTQTGMLCGTAAYMAPEQARGQEVTPSVDLYALGINLHYMLAGNRPFTGKNAITVVVKQLNESPPDLSIYARRRLIPDGLVDLLGTLLAKQPQERPASANDVRLRLAEIRREHDWGAFEVAPPEIEALISDWTRPPLHREVDSDVPLTWRFTDVMAETEPAIAASLVKEAAAAQTRDKPTSDQDDGGWSAFNATPSPTDHGQQAMVLRPVTGELMSVSAGSSVEPAQSVPEPRPVARPVVMPDVHNPRGRVFRDEELVVDLPPRPTTTAPPAEHAREGVDVIKLVGASLLMFVLVLGLIFVFTSTSDAPGPAESPEVAPQDRAEPADTKSSRPKAKRTKKRQDAPKKKVVETEVIDVFDDDPENGRTIIIERKGE